MWYLFFLLLVPLLPILLDASSLLLRARRGRPTPIDPSRGLVIFVESIRWLGVRWGSRGVSAGLRDAGFGGELLYWKWHRAWRGWLVLPAILDRGLLERESQKLAAFITRRRREQPQTPVFVIGYSCGGFVALRAVELLPEGVSVAAVGVLAGAFDPRRYLVQALDHIAGRLVVASSVADWLILGLGTLLLGTADRHRTPAAGMVGLRSGREDARIVEVRWDRSMIRLGHWGGHFSATAPGFIARHVAPALGVGGPSP